ncbi:hypothetical protein HanRHA438_Chr16g0774521 [Helianthus annuus]|nr:hypothetical protein HanRHA438_Chr16g0774521 [Helianthus annuus]
MTITVKVEIFFIKSKLGDNQQSKHQLQTSMVKKEREHNLKRGGGGGGLVFHQSSETLLIST